MVAAVGFEPMLPKSRPLDYSFLPSCKNFQVESAECHYFLIFPVQLSFTRRHLKGPVDFMPSRGGAL